MAEGGGARYAPVPARAIGDQRLSERHLRALAAVAVHDRFGRNGTGCSAGHERLAALTGAHPHRLSETLKDLEVWGYVRRQKLPGDGRRRAYSVVYLPEDGAALDSSPIGEVSSNDTSPYGEPIHDDGSPIGDVSSGERSPIGEVNVEIVPLEKEQVAVSEDELAPNISCETILIDTPKGREPRYGAPVRNLDDLQIDEPMRRWLNDKAPWCRDPEILLEEFRNYHEGGRPQGRKPPMDFRPAFRNWILKARQYRSSAPPRLDGHARRTGMDQMSSSMRTFAAGAAGILDELDRSTDESS